MLRLFMQKIYPIIDSLLFIYLCQTQQRSIITRKTKKHKQIYQVQHKA